MASVASDPASLQNLHDIVVPAAVGWWPLAPGWFVVGAVLMVLAVWAAVRALRRRKRNAYRRRALQELGSLRRAAAGSAASSVALADLAILLRRVALTAYPREQVVGLTGDAWLEFLDRTGGAGAFATGPGRELLVATYRDSSSPSAETVDQAIALAESWVKTHPSKVP